jgi:hypothetical protein
VLEFFDNSVAQRLGAPGDRILIDIVGNSLSSGFLYLLRRSEIWETLGQIHGVVLHRQPRHFADHRFGELLGFGGNHAAGNLRHRRFRGTHFSPWSCSRRFSGRCASLRPLS